MARKWYETWDYRAHKPYWWSTRDKFGGCFEIRKNGDMLDLYFGEHEKLISSYDTLQAAMDAAEEYAAENY